MLTESITCVNHTGINVPAKELRRAAGTVPDDDNVNPHRFQVAGRIDQRFPLADRTGGFRKLNNIRTEDTRLKQEKPENKGTGSAVELS